MDTSCKNSMVPDSIFLLFYSANLYLYFDIFSWVWSTMSSSKIFQKYRLTLNLLCRPAGVEPGEKWLQLEEFLHDELVRKLTISFFLSFYFTAKKNQPIVING
jgi:hypothetical protein